MARITVEDCLNRVGNENRFALIQLALVRLRQHRQGLPYLVEGKNKEVVMTLREIAAGVVTANNVKQFTAKPRHQAPAPPSPLEVEASADAEVEATAKVEMEPAVAEPVDPPTQTEEI